MQLAPGQMILLKLTRERATVIAEREGGRYLVEAAVDDERFEVGQDDIEPVVAPPPRPAAEAAARPEPKRADLRLYPDPDGPAVQLGFLPAGEATFDVALLNFSTESLLYSVHLVANTGQQWERRGVLGSTQGTVLGHLYRDSLNENATVEVEVSRRAETGTDSKQSRSVKLKPKLFYKNTKPVNWFPEDVTLFAVFDTVKLVRVAKESIRAYTQKNVAPAVIPEEKRERLDVNKYGVLAAASFQPELDLHIEKLVEDAGEMKGSEMLELQLKHLESYLDVAIRLGVPKVYIIHGNGSGVLRERIHHRLGTMGDVERFNAGYLPKYGNGATEVIFHD